MKAYKTKSQVNGKPMLGFFIDDGAPPVPDRDQALQGHGQYGQKLHIEVPELAQRVGTAPTQFNGLVSLHTSLGEEGREQA